MNKYHSILSHILTDGRRQANRKGDIISLLNQQLTLTPSDLLDIFESHGIARHFVEVVSQYPEGSVFVDLFGGSGLLSHIAKHVGPKVGYDNFWAYSLF